MPGTRMFGTKPFLMWYLPFCFLSSDTNLLSSSKERRGISTSCVPPFQVSAAMSTVPSGSF